MLVTALSTVLTVASFADGGLSVAELDDLVAFHDADLAACRPAKLTGTSVLQFGVDADGGLEWNAVLRDSRPPSAACFAKALRGWSLPPRSSGTRFQYEWPKSPRAKAAAEDGGLSLEALQQVQTGHRAEVAACFVLHRKKLENDGVFANEVVLGPSGVVLEAEATEPSTRLVGTEVPACVNEAVRGWRFPKGPGRTRATLEWVVAATRERAEVLRPSDAVHAVAVVETDSPVAGVGPTPFARALETQTALLAQCAALPGTGSTIAVEFTITADGGTDEVRSNVEDVRANCVASQVSTWRFPPNSARRTTLEFELDGGSVNARPFPSSKGGLDKAVLASVIREHQGEIRFCYESRLQTQPMLAGKVAVAWVIGADGRVLNAEIAETSVADPLVAQCLVERVRTWVFPKPFGGGTVTVTFPWIFKPADQ